MSCTIFRVPAVLIAAASLAPVALGADIYVNNLIGSDQYDGSSATHTSGQAGPVATLAHAVALLKTSDHLILADTHKPYAGQIVLAGKGGAPGDPMIIEGNGATIQGLAPCPTNQWKQYKDNIYTTEWRAPWGFFVVADGAKPKWCKDLKHIKSGESYCDYKTPIGYYRLPEGKTIDQLHLELPYTASGVVAANASNIIVRNIHSRYYWDDGFDIYGHSVNLRYENIQGSYCGDQGFSAHGYGSAVIVNADMHHDDSAVADTEYSRTTYVGLKGHDIRGMNRGYTIMFQGGEHALIDSHFWNNPAGVTIEPAAGFEDHPGDKTHPYYHARLWLYNDVFDGGEYGLKFTYPLPESVTAEHVTFARVKDGILMKSSENRLHLLSCIIDASGTALQAYDGYFGDYNCWRPAKATLDGKELTSEQWKKLEPHSIFADPKLTPDAMALQADSPAKAKAWTDPELERWLRRSQLWNGKGTGGFLRDMGAELKTP